MKYPGMFRNSRAVVMNKVDLLPHLPYDMEKVTDEIRGIQPEIHIFQVGADPVSVRPLADWLRAEVEKNRA